MLILSTFAAVILPGSAGLLCWACDRPGRLGVAVAATFLLYFCAVLGMWPGGVACCGWVAVAAGRWVHARRQQGREVLASPQERAVAAFRADLEVLINADADERKHAADHDPLPGDRRVA